MYSIQLALQQMFDHMTLICRRSRKRTVKEEAVNIRKNQKQAKTIPANRSSR
jgi:hypothetical protein